MIESIGRMILRGQEHTSCLSARDFSISVPVSWKMRPKLGNFDDFSAVFAKLCVGGTRKTKMVLRKMISKKFGTKSVKNYINSASLELIRIPIVLK